MAKTSLFSYRIILPLEKDNAGVGKSAAISANAVSEFSNFLINFFGFNEYVSSESEKVYKKNKLEIRLNVFGGVNLEFKYLGCSEKYLVVYDSAYDSFTNNDVKIDSDKECIILVPVIFSRGRVFFSRHYPDVIEQFYRCLYYAGKDISGILSRFSRPYKFGRNYIIPVCITIPSKMSGSEFLSNLNEILDIYSLVIMYVFACLRIKRKIVKEIANKLFKPWNITLYGYYKNYRYFKLLVRNNLKGVEGILYNLLVFKSEILNRNLAKQVVDILKHLESMMDEDVSITENKIEESIELHLFLVSIFITIVVSLVMVFLSFLSDFGVCKFVKIKFFSTLYRILHFVGG